MLQQGVPEAEIDKRIDELRTTARKEAVEHLRMTFILEKISEEWDVHVSEEQVNARIAEIAARYNRRFDRVRDELSKGDGLTSLYMQVRDEEIVDRLIEQAEITETEEEVKKTGKSKPAAKKKKSRKKPAKEAE